MSTENLKKEIKPNKKPTRRKIAGKKRKRDARVPKEPPASKKKLGKNPVTTRLSVIFCNGTVSLMLDIFFEYSRKFRVKNVSISSILVSLKLSKIFQTFLKSNHSFSLSYFIIRTSPVISWKNKIENSKKLAIKKI